MLCLCVCVCFHTCTSTGRWRRSPAVWRFWWEPYCSGRAAGGRFPWFRLLHHQRTSCVPLFGVSIGRLLLARLSPPPSSSPSSSSLPYRQPEEEEEEFIKKKSSKTIQQKHFNNLSKTAFLNTKPFCLSQIISVCFCVCIILLHFHSFIMIFISQLNEHLH